MHKAQLSLPLSKLGINANQFSANAVYVTRQLLDAGYEAYIVGGAIRDLMLGLAPKDFDVATNATPEQVKRVFRRARIIGRRFKIVHVYQGRELIEVTTFRKAATQKTQKFQEVDTSGRLLSDNVYGTLQDDVVRRDFSVNAFYYDVEKECVLDFCDGYSDIKNKTLRLLGDPLTRYQEDPVRMLRAVRFKAKLDFTYADDTQQPLTTHQHLLSSVPAARMLEECFKLFLKGHGLPCFLEMQKFGLFAELFPLTAKCLETNDYQCQQVIEQAMGNTDYRVSIDKPVSPVFLFAVLLWAPIQKIAEEYIQANEPIITAWVQASLEVFSAQQSNTSIPRRISVPSQTVVTMQPRFHLRKGRRVKWMLQQPRFRAAYDLMLLRQSAGLVDQETADWWTNIQTLNKDEQDQKIFNKPRHARSKVRQGKKRQRKRKSSKSRQSPKG